MSIINWSTEAPSAAKIRSNRPKAIARRLGLGAGFMMASVTANALLVFAVLLAASILQF